MLASVRQKPCLAVSAILALLLFSLFVPSAYVRAVSGVLFALSAVLIGYLFGRDCDGGRSFGNGEYVPLFGGTAADPAPRIDCQSFVPLSFKALRNASGRRLPIDPVRSSGVPAVRTRNSRGAGGVCLCRAPDCRLDFYRCVV